MDHRVSKSFFFSFFDNELCYYESKKTVWRAFGFREKILIWKIRGLSVSCWASTHIQTFDSHELKIEKFNDNHGRDFVGAQQLKLVLILRNDFRWCDRRSDRDDEFSAAPDLHPSAPFLIRYDSFHLHSTVWWYSTTFNEHTYKIASSDFITNLWSNRSEWGAVRGKAEKNSFFSHDLTLFAQSSHKLFLFVNR